MVTKGVSIKDKEKFMELLSNPMAQESFQIEDRFDVYNIHFVFNDVVSYSWGLNNPDSCLSNEVFILTNEQVEKYNNILVETYMKTGGDTLFRLLIQDKLDQYKSPYDV